MNPENYAVILDITSRKFIMTIIDMHLNIVEKYHYSYSEEYSFEENLILYMKEVALFLQNGLKPSKCIGFGVSVPGPYFPETDRVRSPRMPELNNIPIAQLVRTHLNPPSLFIEAGYNAAATANITRFPDYREKIILYLFVAENDISGTIINRGEIIRGSHNAAGNIGHMIIARGTTLESALKTSNTPEANAYELAKAVHNITRVVDPDTIILECELYRTGDEFVDLVRRSLLDNFDLSEGTIPQLVSGGCKFRRSHRGLTIKLREMWLSNLILNGSV